MALGGIQFHTVPARILVKKGAEPVRLGVPTWPWGQLEGWTPDSSVFLFGLHRAPQRTSWSLRLSLSFFVCHAEDIPRFHTR